MCRGRDIEQCLQLIYRAARPYLSLLFVGGPTYQRSQSFICVGGYTQRARLPVVSCIVRDFTSLMPETRHDVTSRFCIAARRPIT